MGKLPTKAPIAFDIFRLLQTLETIKNIYGLLKKNKDIYIHRLPAWKQIQQSTFLLTQGASALLMAQVWAPLTKDMQGPSWGLWAALEHPMGIGEITQK